MLRQTQCNNKNITMTSKFISLVLLAGSLCSCSNVSSALSNKKTVDSDSNSPIVTRNVSVKNISEIECARGVKVVYTQGATTSVSLSAPNDIADYIVVETDGSALYCSVDKEYQINSGMDRVVVNVVSPAVKSFDASTAATIEVPSGLDLGDNSLTVDATTSATILINSLACGKIDCDLSTAGNVKISGIKCSGSVDVDASTGSTAKFDGSSAEVDFDASTGAEINAHRLLAGKGTADSSTGSSISCCVEHLDGSSSTGGNIHNKR